jgi:hypothetical protein
MLDTCAPVAVYTYTASFQDLQCNYPPPAALFDVEIPGEGRALARLKFQVESVVGVSAVEHFWNCRVSVGDAPGEAIGDDVCPGTMTAPKTVMGFGTLRAGDSGVKAVCYQGAYPCTNGTNRIMPGAVLEVFVEDPQPGCENSSLLFASYYSEHGFKSYWEWPTSSATLLSLPVPVVTRASSGNPTRKRMASVFSVAEGTVWNISEPCGKVPAGYNLVTQLEVANRFVDTSFAVFPGAGGMGHLVISAEAAGVEIDLSTTAAVPVVALVAGKNFVTPPGNPSRGGHTLTTGGCCGGAMLAVVLF